MKKDIEERKADRISMAIVPLEKKYLDPWDIILINQYNKPLKSVLINSKGYDYENEGKEPIKTSTLRYFYEEIPPNSALKIEILPLDLHKLNNEFWISFSLDGYLYDRKFVFVKGSINPDFLINIPIVNELGIFIK